MNAANPLSDPGTPTHQARQRGLALIVDDEATNRLILSKLLTKSGFEVIEASSGARAIELFETSEPRPGLVLMDLMMPLMDGYEATQRIKKIAGENFVPVIFLTATTDQEALAKCIEAGGDDFLTKPFDHLILNAKIRSLERIQQLQVESRHLFQQLMREQEIARALYDGVISAHNVDSPALSTLLRPADLFSGDVLLSEHGPAGDLYVLLGDSTGHGLTAALAALPAADTFHDRVSKGFSAPQVLDAINRKLDEVLPVGIFMAVQLLVVHRDLKQITVCNCGMPDLYVLDGKTGEAKHRARSGSLPLGIAPRADTTAGFHQFPVVPGDRIVLLSDGVLEARNPRGEEFGSARLEFALTKNPASTVAPVVSALDAFCEGTPHHDDVSLAEVLISPDAIIPVPQGSRDTNRTVTTPASHDWELSMTLRGARLRTADPVPLVMNEFHELDAPEHHRQALFAILNELYVNALDHGVLRLNSDLKCSPEGFERYFQLREQRLEALEEGSIRLEVRFQSTPAGGLVHVVIEDSGPGFNAHDGNFHPPKYAGRGITIVKSLCQSVVYNDQGNRVEATFAWKTPRAASARASQR